VADKVLFGGSGRVKIGCDFPVAQNEDAVTYLEEFAVVERADHHSEA
jgi:hypothetical protein